MVTVYIIYSEKLNKYYVGITSTGVKERIAKHNLSYYGNSSFTSRTKDWRLVLTLLCEDQTHALRLEKKIKSMKSKVYIQNLIKYSEMRERIIAEARKN